MADSENRQGSSRVIDWLEARFKLTETFSFLTSFGLFPLELDTRLPLREALAEARKKPVPSYMRFPRVLGLLSVQLFLYLAFSGLMLALYYRPSATEAHLSVTTIVRDVSFGWLVHQSHLWAGRALLAILLVRVCRFFFEGLYKSPREGLWLVGVLLLAGSALADLTGRMLTHDVADYWATVRGVEVIQRLPVVGPAFVFLLGGTSFDSVVLTRAYVLHCAWIPVFLLGLFHLNLVGVRRVGLSTGDGAKERGGHRTYAYDVLILSVVVFGVLLTAATLLPQPFGAAADPFNTPASTRPPWYLLATHAALEKLPAMLSPLLAGWVVELAFLLVLLVPFLDRGEWRPARQRPVAVAVGVLVLVLITALTWQGYRMEVSP